MDVINFMIKIQTFSGCVIHANLVLFVRALPKYKDKEGLKVKSLN